MTNRTPKDTRNGRSRIERVFWPRLGLSERFCAGLLSRCWAYFDNTTAAKRNLEKTLAVKHHRVCFEFVSEFDGYETELKSSSPNNNPTSIVLLAHDRLNGNDFRERSAQLSRRQWGMADSDMRQEPIVAIRSIMACRTRMDFILSAFMIQVTRESLFELVSALTALAWERFGIGIHFAFMKQVSLQEVRCRRLQSERERETTGWGEAVHSVNRLIIARRIFSSYKRFKGKQKTVRHWWEGVGRNYVALIYEILGDFKLPWDLKSLWSFKGKLKNIL